MKAREIQIGDWVEEHHACKRRFTQVDGETLLFMMQFNSPIEPIPLTPEILEKNGFISYPQDRIVIWRNDYSFAIECDLTTWEYYWANGDVKINYVHELQHALRLCGLNELADNFQV